MADVEYVSCSGHDRLMEEVWQCWQRLSYNRTPRRLPVRLFSESLSRPPFPFCFQFRGRFIFVVFSMEFLYGFDGKRLGWWHGPTGYHTDCEGTLQHTENRDFLADRFIAQQSWRSADNSASLPTVELTSISTFVLFPSPSHEPCGTFSFRYSTRANNMFGVFEKTNWKGEEMYI